MVDFLRAIRRGSSSMYIIVCYKLSFFFSFSRQLCVCLEQILKHDFPTKWTGIVMTVHNYLASSNKATWLGSLHALYQLSKKYK